MPGRHRKPCTSRNTAIRLARTGALTVMASAPLAVATGTALAAPSAGADDDVPAWSRHHGRAWYDRDSDNDTAHTDRLASHHSYSRDEDDGDGPDEADLGGQDPADLGDDDSGWSNGGHYTPRRSPSGTSGSGSSASDARWDRIAQCESGGNWDADTGNGYKGGLQFTPSTWRGYGGQRYAPSPDQASREQQIAVAKKVQRAQGWQAWPSCSHKMGYA